MHFQLNDISTYTIRLIGDKLQKKLQYNTEKLKLDYWAKSLNAILYEINTKKFYLKRPYIMNYI